MSGAERGLEEPLTPLEEAAMAAHAIYEAYVRAGFTPEQSTQITTALILARYVHLRDRPDA